MQGTEDTELTLTREGGFVGSEDDNVEEIKFFEGQFNRITFEQVMNWIGMNFAPQVYNKTLKLCSGVYQDLQMHLPAPALPV